MAFHDVRFPEIIESGMVGGPTFSTAKGRTGGGKSYRNSNWDQPLYEWECGTGIRDQDALDILIAFFMARRGAANSFRFKDWVDYRATLQVLGTGDGTNKVFQLRKAYTSGDVTLWRKIILPVSGTVKIFKDGVEQLSGVTVNHATGEVAFSASPTLGEVIAWSGEFDVKVFFTEDKLPVELIAVDVGQISNFKIEEERD